VALRVGFDAVRALRNSTGLGNYARRVLRGVLGAEAGVEGVLYSPAPPRREFAGLARSLGAEAHFAAGVWAVPGARSYWRSFRLGHTAAEHGIQLYHGLTHEIPRDLPRTGIPSVVSFLDLLWVRFPRLYRGPDRKSYEWRYRWSAEHAGAVVAVSRQTHNDLVELYGVDPARVTVIPPPADPRFSVAVPERDRREVLSRYGLPDRFLLSLGTLEPRKNQRTAISALARLDPRNTPPLVLIGRDGGSAAGLARLAEQLGVAERVIFCSNMRDDDLPAVMQSAALFLYPSLFEGFGLPIVEALGAGVPVIASEGGCFPEAGGPGTLYAPATDAVEWARLVERVLHDPVLAERMTAAGRVHAQGFDGGQLAQRMLALYDAVRTGSPLPAEGEAIREERDGCAG